MTLQTGEDRAALPWDATSFVPTGPERTLDDLRAAAASCQACDLYRTGTQTIFGEGPPASRVVFVGEQPGDSEDREGHPFGGPGRPPDGTQTSPHASPHAPWTRG